MIKICKHCGKQFESKQERKKLCSSYCHQANSIKTNPDKWKEKQDKWKEKNKDRVKAYQKWYQANKVDHRTRWDIWTAENPGKAKAIEKKWNDYRIKEISRSYVATLLNISTRELDEQTYEEKKLQVKLKRLINEKQKRQTNSSGSDGRSI